MQQLCRNDGSVSKVEFYNGSRLLHTETVVAYGFKWRDVPVGNYTITTKATGTNGLVTTSAAVHITVVPNKAPKVTITGPANKDSFTVPATILLTASATDPDGRISRVEFYNGNTLLRTEYKFPYRYHWQNVPEGTYIITAAAIDNYGAKTTSAPVTVTMTSKGTIAVTRKPFANNKTSIKNPISARLAPNPASQIVNIYATGLQQDKQATISVISASGVIMKTIQVNSSGKPIQLDVSSLLSGVYTIELLNGENAIYRQFVKS